jgi:hypothetical protein
MLPTATFSGELLAGGAAVTLLQRPTSSEQKNDDPYISHCPPGTWTLTVLHDFREK